MQVDPCTARVKLLLGVRRVRRFRGVRRLVPPSVLVVASVVPAGRAILEALPDELLLLCMELLVPFVGCRHSSGKYVLLCTLGCLELTCKKFEELVILSQFARRTQIGELAEEGNRLWNVKTAESLKRRQWICDKAEHLEQLLLRRRLQLPRRRPRDEWSSRAMRRARVSELHVLAYRGRASLVAPLVQARADVENASCTHGTPLMVAIRAGHVGVVSALLEATAQTDDAKNDMYDFAGDMPLTMAVKSGRVDVVQALLDGGANIDWLLTNEPRYGLVTADDELWFGDYHRPGCRRGGLGPAAEHWSTPLHDACLLGHHAMVAALLEAGADVDERADPDESARDRTPHQVVQEAGHHDIAKLLVEYGASCEIYPDPVKVSAHLFPLKHYRSGLVHVTFRIFCISSSMLELDRVLDSDEACYPSSEDF